MHEAQMHPSNCYLTLTYDQDHLPPGGNLTYRDFQLFMKRLRKQNADKSIRFYMAGEYGDESRRPHFHAAIFNHDFQDKTYLRKTPQGHILYTSPLLGQLWTQGYSSIGALTFQSAAYIARYILKKITGDKQQNHYKTINPSSGEISQLTPEYNHMSMRPGIGATWLKKYYSDVYPDGVGVLQPTSTQGTVLINGHQSRPPRYYDNLFKKAQPLSYRRLIAHRTAEALKQLPDNTNPRLEAKLQVKNAALSHLKRRLKDTPS